MQTTTIPLWTISQDEYKAIKEGVLLEVNGQKTFVQVGPISFPLSDKRHAPNQAFSCTECGDLFENLRAKGTHEWHKHGIHGQNAARNAKHKAKATKKTKKRTSK